MKFTLPSSFEKLLGPLHTLLKHHYIVGFVMIGSALLFVGYTINQTLGASADAQYRETKMRETIATKFNKSTDQTLTKIESLQLSSDPVSQQPPLPPGRINPFAE